MNRVGLAVRHVDLSASEEEPQGDGRAALVVFWWGELPLGMRLLSAEEMPLRRGTLAALTASFVAEQRAARDQTLGGPLTASAEGVPRRALTVPIAGAAEHSPAWLAEAALPSLRSASNLSVVICTRDRTEQLALCLQSLLAQRSPPGELIVVDNAVNANAAELCKSMPQVRYLHEPRAGLSYARNAGLMAATRSFIAFTDDDVTPHPHWTAEIVRALEDSEAEAVTGLVLPGRLDTWAQRCFQLMMGGFGDRFVPVLFERNFFAETRADGAHVWRIGAGANMAFRRSVFARVGLFDHRLGAGASGCSEDSELWYRILATGGTCLYEPRAVVFHEHRADWRGLELQVRAYMRGHVSALVAQRDRFDHRGNIVRIFNQLPRYFVRTAMESFLHHTPDRRRLLWQEFAGWASGLTYLFRLRWRRDRPRPSISPSGMKPW